MKASMRMLGLEPTNLTQDIGPSSNRSAILLLDYQNEFLKEGGKCYGQVSGMLKSLGVLEKAPKLLDFARKRNAMILYSPVVMRESEMFWVNKAEEGRSFYEQQGLFTANTWHCEIAHVVEPKTTDTILRDRCGFSAFLGTDLLSHLQENKVKHFFVAGFLTDMCVYRTLIDATELLVDTTIYVISDCCAARSIEDHNGALEKLRGKSIHVVDASEAKSVLTKCAESMKQDSLLGNDEWLMIDKIFAAGGVEKEEAMDGDILLSLIGNIGSKPTNAVSSLTSTIRNVGQKRQVSRDEMHSILFKRKSRMTFLEKLPLFLLMIYMPFLYSISTRIPFIFVALEITKARDRKLWVVGLVLGVYQSSRALGNLIIVSFGGDNPFHRLQLPLIFSSLFGWFFLSLYGRPDETSIFLFQPYFESDSIFWPLFALFFVGLCETIVILQRSIMIETAKESPSGVIDEAILGNRFSLQYAFVSFGAVVAFMVGGWLYTNYGFYTVCDFGIMIQFYHLFGAILYLAFDKKSKKNLKSKDLDGHDVVRSVIYQFTTFSVISKYSQGVANSTGLLLKSESSELSAAAIKAKEDRVLNHSLSEMYRNFFHQNSDDVASFAALIASTGKRESSASFTKRPLATNIGKRQLSKLVLSLMKTHGDGKLTEGEFVSFWAPRVYLSMFESSQESSVSVIWPYMRAVVATQAIAALCIGVFLSTALLSYTERFEMKASQVGVLLGIGELLGCIGIFAKTLFSSFGSFKPNNNLIPKAMISRPLNVPFVLIFAGMCSMLFSVDNRVFAIMCQMMYSSVNDLSVSLMNELIGTSLPPNKFKYYQGIGQWLRRLGNMITAVLGPILYEFSSGLPFLLFGGIVIVWALILWSLMYAHAARIDAANVVDDGKEDDQEEKEKEIHPCLVKSGIVQPFQPFLETTRTHWYILEQRYYAMNKDRIDESLNGWKKASVDISLMEHRIRCLAAALEVERHQRRALEDRMYARVTNGHPSPITPDKPTTIVAKNTMNEMMEIMEESDDDSDASKISSGESPVF
eukprot:CAMPEP_0197199352 /NCGR_PEP_ID=MMETSP1423-20130617/33838_1 /TAXON_ID=476441 /ORGANISM="Pseudo-nitzschia heimii, Strain UNC1101" /LENGTH=1033 /DNA_ID=CAMNT_0042653207 /DNA_START=363 /DNA_END=3464 /DNA_ORIENTATION=-